MASIFRRFRNFVSCITSKEDQDSDVHKYQDAAYYWKDGPKENVKLVSFRMLSDSKENLQADRNDEEEIKSEFQISSELNETEEPPIADIPFPMITNFPDVVVQVGKDHKFPTTKKVLCDYSDYFYQRLASNKERLCVLKVDEQFVNQRHLKPFCGLCFKTALFKPKFYDRSHTKART
ncbi:hypothetical protein JTE90_028195 [Oedothorax gibbosus]|uniref:BTB domain-containing protein n=1 Tax=Oedothorax gibbosus TaxID=931172 RepID=A0AAV6TD83_9ARAC|nr:hypothetical protein JTE90_028195 [Oedothorax gibbosus]